MNWTKFLKHIGSDNEGATAVEYGLIVSLIVIAMVGALQSVANENTKMWGEIEAKVIEANTKAD
ncbi:MAG: Flp family type IVb pilin [Pseudomonadota bacterium]